VKSHASALQGRPTAFVSVCLAVLEKSEKANADLQAILRRFFTETGWIPPVTKIVAGALLYTRYNWFIRLMMRRIVARAHGDTDTSRDYEYTDWSDVRAFGQEFARRVVPSVVPTREKGDVRVLVCC
jgi:menaquinone-dependent protoporphyrinogen oxidase